MELLDSGSVPPPAGEDGLVWLEDSEIRAPRPAKAARAARPPLVRRRPDLSAAALRAAARSPRTRTLLVALLAASVGAGAAGWGVSSQHLREEQRARDARTDIAVTSVEAISRGMQGEDLSLQIALQNRAERPVRLDSVVLGSNRADGLPITIEPGRSRMLSLPIEHECGQVLPMEESLDLGVRTVDGVHRTVVLRNSDDFTTPDLGGYLSNECTEPSLLSSYLDATVVQQTSKGPKSSTLGVVFTIHNPAAMTQGGRLVALRSTAPGLSFLPDQGWPLQLEGSGSLVTATLSVTSCRGVRVPSSVDDILVEAVGRAAPGRDIERVPLNSSSLTLAVVRLIARACPERMAED